MHNLPFDTINVSGDEMQMLEDIYKELKSKLDIISPEDIKLTVTEFDLFSYHKEVSIGGSLLINHPVNPCYLLFIKIHYFYRSARGGEDTDFYKYQVWGCITTRKDYGRILIRHETFADKILGLIHPVELEFKDDKAFSNKFFICTNDEQKALLAMNWNFRNAVMDISDENIMIETVNNTLIIGRNKDLNTEETLQLTEILLKLASVC